MGGDPQAAALGQLLAPAGGLGGSRQTTTGETAPNASYNGGGGGGASGRVRLNAPSITAGGTDVSPSPSTSTTVSTF